MSNSKTKAAPVATRGRGRPASFQGVDTVPFLVNIPTTTRQMIRDFADKREIAINLAMHQLIARGYKEATR